MEFEFERKAMNGQPLPKGLDVADSCLYVALKSLYAMYKNKQISRENAKEEKRSLIYNWTLDKSNVIFLERQSLALNKRIFEASEKYKNNPSIETADELYAAFYNLPKNWRKV